MRLRFPVWSLALIAMIALTGCSSDSGDNPTDPGQQNTDYDGIFSSFQFHDFGAFARQVLPPPFEGTAKSFVDPWRDGEYPLLGKVFSQDEPMSIHRNIDDHDMMMDQIDEMIGMVANYEAHHDTLPDAPFPVSDTEHGNGTMTLVFIQPTTPVAVPAVCQTVFGQTAISVENVIQMTMEYDDGFTWESPYFGFSVGGQVETLYYWAVGMSEAGTPEGSQLFYATRDTLTEAIEIAGSYFKEDGPGDEERCNWVYHMTGNSQLEFTYNMGWYSENPQFQLFGCVQGSGDKDEEFGLRYHEYNDTTGWVDYFVDSVSEDIFGPVDGDPFASIPPENRAGTLEDYVDPNVMYVVGDSPLEDIPNPFAGLF